MTSSGERSFREGREAAEVGEHHGADRSHATEPQVVVGPSRARRRRRAPEGIGRRRRERGALEVVEALLREPGVDPCPQQHRVERLRQVVVGADLDATYDAVDLVDGRDHDDRDVRGARRRLETLERLDAVELRHEDVEQDDVAGSCGEQVERFATVRGHADGRGRRLRAGVEAASDRRCRRRRSGSFPAPSG